MIAKGEAATKHAMTTSKPMRGVRDTLPKKRPQIKLRHGQALWLLATLGYRGSASGATFREYIKSLRKLGIPFGSEKFLTKQGRRLADYSYCRVMELALTLSLRVYHIVPDSVLKGIIQYRGHLDQLYCRAYAQRDSGPGRPIVIAVAGRKSIVLRGVFLDLNIRFSGGHLVRFGPPKLLPAIAALQQFSLGTSLARPLMPIALSILSEQVVSLALRAPYVRSGPRGHSDQRGHSAPS